MCLKKLQRWVVVSDYTVKYYVTSMYSIPDDNFLITNGFQGWIVFWQLGQLSQVIISSGQA